MDASYCGIDQYETDESLNDEDFGFSMRLFDELVQEKIINRSEVENTKYPAIQFTIYLSDKSKLIFECDEEEYCILKYQIKGEILFKTKISHSVYSRHSAKK